MARAGWTGGRGRSRVPQIDATSLQGSRPRPATLKTPGSAVAGDELDGADDVVLLDELHERVEAEDRRAERPGEVLGDRGDDVGAEHVGEAEEGDDDVGVVVGEVVDERLGLDEGPFDRGPRWRGPRRVLGEGVRVLLGRAVDERRRLDDDVPDGRPGGAGRGEEVHRPDDVDLVQGAGGDLGGVDDEEGVDDRVDLGGADEAVEDRVRLVGADVLGPLERHGRVLRCRARGRRRCRGRPRGPGRRGRPRRCRRR